MLVALLHAGAPHCANRLSSGAAVVHACAAPVVLRSCAELSTRPRCVTRPAGAKLGRQAARGGYMALSSMEPNETLVPRTAVVVLR